MVTLTRSLTVFPDGSIQILDVGHPPTLPDSEPEPKGARAVPGVQFLRVISDCANPGMNYRSRTFENPNIQMTNAMYVPRRWYYRPDVGEYRVDQYSKITFWPERLSFGWASYFFSGMTERQHGLFNGSGFGWRDSKANPDELNIYNFILCTGALLRKKNTFREFTLFECQEVNGFVDWNVSYLHNPDKWFKQSISAHDAAKNSYCGSVNQAQLDLYIPTACPGGVAAILTSETVPAHPELPFNTFWHGAPVKFIELCFRGSECLGLTDGGKWLYIEQQTSKTGKAHLDFTLHIPVDDWCAVRPVPVAGWQKE